MGLRYGLEVSTTPRNQISVRVCDVTKISQIYALLQSIACCSTANNVTSYALQWLFVLPIEIISGALTIQFWNSSINPAIFVTIFLITIVTINMFGIKGYGEAEFIFSTVKVTAIVGFM